MERVRVLRLLHVREGRESDFVESYRSVLKRAERFPGHLGEQLCRSLDDPARWLLTSEWESLQAVQRWRTDPDHQALVRPMNACLHEDRSTSVFRIRDLAGPAAV
ncbi:antibiotic biosynthesis monooxygenase family protein [Streptomyces caeruleatus]|uniref:WhiE I-like protein n=1 Tax=Streptomyces caeruleatus TaxID=661399 RepID=A0A101U5Z0_9ACTN|nr:antibiotic biosynthesis monooxygenase family protein [Streptomyces caeruleatus]KUO04728.1 WhiE I-like protein [Streptomyces caeruleatus]